ncbi:unnamed protein product [marine sediment metagenome]|uniref:Uncharacterized protein n=1 Tax=marine sediment metagenome TaxID=412755 RepID=X1QHC7_9ZZZZ
MSVLEPISYGDWYWKQSVDAIKARSEAVEKIYTPIVNGLLHNSGLYEYMPDFFKPLFDNIAAPTEDAWEDVQRLFLNATTAATSALYGDELARPGMYAMKADKTTLKIDADMAAILTQRKLMSEPIYALYGAWTGYDKAEAAQFYKSRLPYPSIPDIITASRYLGDWHNPQRYAMSLFDIPDRDYKIWDWLSYQKLTTGDVQELFKRNILNGGDTDEQLGKLGWHEWDGFMIKSLAHSLPNPMLMAQGLLLQDKGDELILNGISEADIKPAYAQTYLDAVMTKPANEDIIAYELRRDPSLSNLDIELRRIGIHKNYYALYKELAYQIPPVNDIITMAVREAFTPAIAARFGQYQDLPPDFVEWAGKKGLSKEWAERYWAAHWSLPSPQQGFEMLHRGVIGFDDLNMLLRALDVMPFWRDKLVEIAYRPLSRVDVRRMFKLGVLDVKGVRKAYTDIGYNDYNADLMTQFTIEYVKGVPKKLSTTDMVTAYKKHLIDSGTLRSQLSEAGITGADLDSIIKTAEQRREWSDREENIATIEFLYKQGRYTEDKTITELRNLKLADDYIHNLIPQWTAKSVAEKETLWTTAQTLSFMKANLITVERGKQELTDIGYDDEHINVYLASAKPE